MTTDAKPRIAILGAGPTGLEAALTAVDGGFGHVLEAPGSTLERLYEEHGQLALAGGDELTLGQQVRIVPNHVCVAVHLHDHVYGVRGGELERSWPIEARGRARRSE